MITFAMIEPGVEVGRSEIRVDDRLAELWFELFPDGKDADLLPAGLTMALVMRAYMSMLHPHPPGNIHAGQRLRLGSPLRRGDLITTRLTCRSKQIRNERRWVRFAIDSRSDGDVLVCEGEMTVVWAA